MAHVEYTGTAKQLFDVINEIKEKTKELAKLSTDIKFGAKFDKGALTGLRTDAHKAADIIGKNLVVKIKAQVTGHVEAAKKLRDYYSKNIMAKVQPYVTNAGLQAVKNRIQTVLGRATVNVDLKFQNGAAAKFRETLKRMLAVLSRGSYVDAELRLKGAARAIDQLRNKKLLLDVDVATGTAAKIRALLALLKELRNGAKIPIKLDIDTGLQTLLKNLVKDLKAAADQASRLNQRLNAGANSSTRFSSSINSSTGSLRSMTQAIGAWASGILLAQGMNAAFAALKDTLFDFPAKLEQIKVGFVGLFGGSVEKADQLEAALKAFAIPTPFELIDLAPLAQQALAFDLVDKNAKNAVQETVSLLNDVGDAAFGLGRGQPGVDRLLLALGQMQTATRVMGGEMLQLQQLGLNAWKYLAEATGKSTKEVRDLVSQGLVPAKEAIAAIRAGIQRDFGGAMVRASKTALGAISQIKDTLQVRLSENFATQFEQVSQGLVKLADYLGTNNFGQKLDQVADTATAAIERIGEAWQFLTLLYQNNQGTIDVALVALGTRLLWLNAMARGGPIGAFLTLASALQLMSQRSDQYGDVAQKLTPVLYAVAAGYLAIKAAAAQAAIAQGIQASVSGATAGLTGLAAASARLAGTVRGISQFMAVFRFMVSQQGAITTLRTLFTGLASSISIVGLVALPVLVAAFGTAAIAGQKYQEKVARVDAANAQLAVSSQRAADALETVSKIAMVDESAAASITKLKDRYDELKGSAEGLAQFKMSLPLAQRDIAVNPRLTQFDKAALQASIRELERQVDAELADAQFKAEVEVEANPTSLANLTEAFNQTFGDWENNAWVSAPKLFEPILKVGNETIQAIGKGFDDLAYGWKKGWGDAFDSIFGDGETALGNFADFATRKFDTMVAYLGDVWTSFIRWFNGQSANADDGGAELPPTYSAAELAEQKRRAAEYKKANGSKRSFGEVYGPPVLPPGPERDRAIIARHQAANRPAPTTIPEFEIDESGKKKKKTEAQKAAEKAAREAEAAARKERAAALKLEKDQLADSAKAWDAKAKAVADSAKLEIEALTGLRDSLRDIFGSMQEELLRLGIINDPLGPLIQSFEKVLDLGGRSEKVIKNARTQFDAFKGKANAARSRSELLSGQDGIVNGTVASGSDATAAKIALSAVRMQAVIKSGTDKFVKGCDRLADKTVNSATKIYSAIMGPRKGDTAARTMDRFKAKGIGFAAGANYQPMPGDIVYSGATKKNASGHVMIVGPDGKFYDQYTSKRGSEAYTPTTKPEWVVRSGSGGKSTDAGGLGPGMTGVNRYLQRDSLKNDEGSFDLDRINGSLSKIQAVDVGWGKAVKNIESNTFRFAMQTHLASEAGRREIGELADAIAAPGFQDKLDELNAKLGTTFKVHGAGRFAAADLTRQWMNYSDAVRNSVVASDAATASIGDLNKATSQIGKEKNPLSEVFAEFQPGGKFAAAPGRAIELLDAKLKNFMASAAVSTREATQAERDRIKVLQMAAPAISAATAGTDAYDRALEDSQRRVDAWKDATVVGMLQAADSLDVMGGKALAVHAELKKLAGDPVLKAFGLAPSMEQVNAAQARGNGLKGRAAGLRTSANQRVGAITTAQATEANYRRGEERRRENIDANFELDNRIKLLNRENVILLDGTKSEDQRTDAIDRANFILDEQIRLMKSGHKEARAYILAYNRANKREIASGIQRRNEALKQYNQSTIDTAKAQAAFGDTTGLAALKFELAEGNLKSLTEAQKAKMLVDEAARLGLQKYGQEFDSLYSQQFSIQADYAQRQMQLAGAVSPLMQQELKWKYEDLELSARLAGMTQAEKDAYNEKLPVIQKLRTGVRELLAQSDKLAGAEWFKQQGRRMKILMEPDEAKRARLELEQQLEDAGFTDSVVIKAILDASDIERKAEKFRGYMDEVKGIFEQGFKDAEESGPKAFFASVINGVADMIASISRQIISSKLTELLVGLFGGMTGGTNNSDVSGGNTQSNIELRRPASYRRIGHDYIPYDGYRVVAHKGEAILTARENAMYQAMTVPDGRGRKFVGGGDSGGNSISGNQIVINLPHVREPEKAAPAIQDALSKLSRRSQQNSAYDKVSPGGRQR